MIASEEKKYETDTLTAVRSDNKITTIILVLCGMHGKWDFCDACQTINDVGVV